jgi:hypothetical protein
MQLKSITVILVLLLVVASLLVTGCSTSNTNQTPSATASTATHDAFLESYLAAYKNVMSSNSSLSVKAWELTWTNGTSARLQWTTLYKPTNQTLNYDETLTVFPNSQDATNYLNAINKTAYSLASTIYPSGGAYQKAEGHQPQIFKDYVYNEGNPFNISEYQRHEISQLDNIVIVSTGKYL